jgi:hypothetical protein
MQDTDQAELSPDKTGILGQKLRCSCRSTKEQVIDKRLVTAGEWAQGGGQGEGEHEVRDFSSHSWALSFWHFGQWRLRQEW